jgi:hypothetical protein
MSRPESGPASQLGQPPTRAGTYCVGPPAAPALTRKTVLSTPNSPAAPNMRAMRVWLALLSPRSLQPDPVPLAGAWGMGAVTCMRLIVTSGPPASLPWERYSLHIAAFAGAPVRGCAFTLRRL